MNDGTRKHDGMLRLPIHDAKRSPRLGRLGLCVACGTSLPKLSPLVTCSDCVRGRRRDRGCLSVPTS